MRGLQIGAGFWDYKSGQEVLQIGKTLGISHRGKEISYRGWDYKSVLNKANSELICRQINQFSWDNKFSNIDVNQKVYLFNQTVKNVLSNFIPHETVICDVQDPAWIKSKTKSLI